MNKNLPWILLKYQLVILLVMLVLSYILFKNVDVLLSVLCGSLIAALPVYLYGYIVFSKGLVVKPKLALLLHQKAMLLKFVLNLILFVLVILIFRHCNYMFLFTSYIITQAVIWLILLKK